MHVHYLEALSEIMIPVLVSNCLSMSSIVHELQRLHCNTRIALSMGMYVVLKYCAQQAWTQMILGNVALSSAVTNLLEQRNSPNPLAGTQWTSSCSMMFRSCPEWYASCFVCHVYGMGDSKHSMIRKWGSMEM